MTTSSPFGTPIWNWLINPLPKWEGWFPSLFFCCTVQTGLHTRRCRTTYRYSLDFFIFFRLRTRSTLPKFFALFVPLFCRLLPYEGTLMLPPFEMLVRSPVLLVCHTQGLRWPNVCRTAYTFRVPGPVFKASLIFRSFFSCTFSPFQHTRGVDDAQIRQYFCWMASFLGSCAQLRDTAGPNIFQTAKTKLLPFAARSSHRFQHGRCCANPTQCCLSPDTGIYIKRKSN